MINQRWFRKKQVYLFLKKLLASAFSDPHRLGKSLEKTGWGEYQICIHFFFLFNRNQIFLSVSMGPAKILTQTHLQLGENYIDIFSWWNNLKNLLDSPGLLFLLLVWRKQVERLRVPANSRACHCKDEELSYVKRIGKGKEVAPGALMTLRNHWAAHLCFFSCEANYMRLLG